jgi:spermidine synthase
VDNGDRELRQILAGIVACFFLSGATGLVYEVLWIRMLGLVFGHTVFAITTVLTAFMAGLGLGGLLFGRIADRHPHPLVLYGTLEAGIGLSCLLIPLLLPRVEALYLTLYSSLHLSFFAFSLAQFALILVLLLVPTTLMGATLPVLSRFFVKDDGTLAKLVGLLYALNTFGAVLGTALAGYFLLPNFGMRGTLYLAAALNIGIGALVIVYDQHLRRLRPADSTEEGALPQPTLPEVVPPPKFARLVALTVIGLGLSGAASMIYEVAWTRVLSLIIGSSTYAFTAMLLAFLVGIAAGSALFSRLWGQRRVGPMSFGTIELGIGLSALLILPAFGKMPDLLLRAFTVSMAPDFVLIVQVLLSISAMIVPTLLIGASFPCAVKVAARRVNRVGLDVGRLYAINTLGAIVGTVLAGFFLIPAHGVQTAVKVAVLLNLAIGLGIAIGSARILRGWQWATSSILSVAILAGVFWMPAWNQAVMASGVAIYAPIYQQKFAGKIDLARAFHTSNVLFYEDGVSATVTVHRSGEHTFLKVNGKTDASTATDMHTQLMSGHIPLLLHPNPKTVLVIGLGSGVTLGAVAQYPLERIDVVEIEPAVVKASRFFAKENREALKDPRVHLVTADGRNFLLATSRRYDVIISEPSNPWIGGLAALFSQEFYEIAKRRLSPGGIMLQWVQGYSLLPSDLKMVVRTFRTAFPATSIWQATGPVDYLLVGQERTRPLDLGRVQAMYEASPAIRQDMERLGFRSPYALLADFLLTEQDAARYAQNADVNTDDLLPLEFSAPRSLYLDTANLNWVTLTSFRTSEFPPLLANGLRKLDDPEVRHDLGVVYLQKSLLAQAAAEFEKALAKDPKHLASLLELGRVQIGLHLPLKAVESFETVLRHDPRNAEAYLQLALAYQAQQFPARALLFASKAVALKPQNPAYQTQLALLLENQGRYSEAVEHYLAARREKPTDVSILNSLGSAYLKLGRVEETVQVLEEALSHQPDNPLLNHGIARA